MFNPQQVDISNLTFPSDSAHGRPSGGESYSSKTPSQRLNQMSMHMGGFSFQDIDHHLNASRDLFKNPLSGPSS